MSDETKKGDRVTTDIGWIDWQNGFSPVTQRDGPPVKLDATYEPATIPCPHCGGAVPDPRDEELPHDTTSCPCSNCNARRALAIRYPRASRKFLDLGGISNE